MSMINSVNDFLGSLDDSDGSLFPYLANKRERFDPSKDTVYYSGPFWDSREVATAIETLIKGNWLTSGDRVNRFERRFSKEFNFTESVMVNSGSSPNLVMIAALKKFFGWNDGDKIIVSVVGFPTTVAPFFKIALSQYLLTLHGQT